MLAGARLTVLDLSDNAFGPDGVKGIEKLLKSNACYTLQELRLNNCGMGIGGGKVCNKNVWGWNFLVPFIADEIIVNQSLCWAHLYKLRPLW